MNADFQVPAKMCHPVMFFFAPIRMIIEQWASAQHREVKVDRLDRVLMVPNDLAPEAKAIIGVNETKPKVENYALGCIMLCNDPEQPTLTEHPITIFYEDGHQVTERLCRSCQEESLFSAVGHLMDDIQSRGLIRTVREKIPKIPLVDCEENDRHELWPHIPIKALLLILLREGERMSALVNTWVLAVYYQTFRTSPELVQACPNHLDVILIVNPKQTG
jgi:hypothetical protein